MTPEDVPAGPIMVDTNVFSIIFTKKLNSRWSEFARLLTGHILVMSFASYGEALAFGHKAKWGQRRMAELQSALRGYIVARYDAEIVRLWAPMHAKLSGHLHKGGTNDLWTAACALAADPQLPLATADLADFQKIADESGLSLIHPDL